MRAHRIADVIRSGSLQATALLFVAGVCANLIDPRPAFEVAQTVMSEAWLAGTIVAAATAGETAFAALVFCGLLPPRAAAPVAIVAVGALEAWLLAAQRIVGGEHECGCHTALFRHSIRGSLRMNSVVLAALVLTTVACVLSRKDPRSTPRSTVRAG